jgi:protein-S-isoprenylcysteine O-methyltransferase Ste14
VRASRLRVRLGYVAFLVAMALARPRPEWLALGVGLAVIGEGLRLWASGHIEKTHRLATGGPYAHTRNPLYLGSVVIALGFAVSAGSVGAIVVTLVYLAAFYPSVIREEAAFLRAKFPDQYAAWQAQVPIFLPRLSPGGPRDSRFAWQRVKANREWRAALSVPLVVLALCARGRWLPLL